MRHLIPSRSVVAVFTRVACALLLAAALQPTAWATPPPPPNQPPTATAATDTITVLEDAATYSYGDFLTAITGVEAGQTVALTIANNNHALFSMQPTITRAVGVTDKATLTFKPAANKFGTATVTIGLKDNGSILIGGPKTNFYTVEIIVTPVNDAPTIATIANQAILEDSGQHTVTLTGITAGPANESENLGGPVTTDVPVVHIDDQSVTLYASSFPTGIVENISIDYSAGDTTAILHYSPVRDAFGTATITVVATDDGGTDNDGVNTFSRTFKVTVTPVNDTPRFKFSQAPPLTMFNKNYFNSSNDATDLASGNVASLSDPNWIPYTEIARTSDGKLWQLGFYSPGGPTTATITGGVLANIDPNSGVATPVVPSSGFTGGLAADGSDTLWAVANNGALATINKETGEFTLIGDTELGSQFYLGLAFDGSGALWYLKSDSTFGTIDLGLPGGTSGAFSSLSHQVGTISTLNGSPYSGGSLFGLTYFNGKLYTAGYDTSTFHDGLMALDTTDGIPNGNLLTTSYSINQDFTLAGPIAQGTQVVVAVDEDAGAQTVEGFAKCILAGPANENTQTLSFIVTVPTESKALFKVLPKITLPSPSSTLGTLTFTPAPDANGMAVVSVKLHDTGGTANLGDNESDVQTFIIKINPVNDAPVMKQPAPITVYETPNNPNNVINSTVSSPPSDFQQAHHVTLTGISPGPANEGSQTVMAIYAFEGSPLSGSSHFEGIVQNVAVDYSPGSTTATLYFDTAVNQNGSDTITIFLVDNGGGGGVASEGGASGLPPGVGMYTVNVTVRPVNSPPSFDGPNNTDVYVAEDSGPQTFENFLSNISPGPADESAQTVKFVVTAADKTLFTTQPAITVTYPAASSSYLSGLSGAVAWFQAEGTTDDSAPGTANNGTAYGNVTYSAGKVGQAFTFDGNDGGSSINGTHIEVPDQSELQLTSALTIELWVKTSSPAEQIRLVNKLSNASGFRGYNFDIFNGQLRLELFSGGSSATAMGGSGLTDGNWHHVAATYDKTAVSDNLRIYIDGTQVGSANGSFDVDSASGIPLRMGAWYDDSGGQWMGFFNGQIDEVTLYNRALSQSEIQGIISAVTEPKVTLTFKPRPNAFGTTTVTVRAVDSGGMLNGGFNTSAPRTFTIHITPQNDPPTLAQPGFVQMVEDTTRTITLGGITAGPLNESDQTLTFTVTSRPHSAGVHNPFPETLTTLTYTGGTKATLVLQPNANEFGIADIDVTITDNGVSGRYLCNDFKSLTRTFRVTVTPDNDPPSFTKGADQVTESGASAQTVTGWATAIAAGPDNELGQTVSFVLSVDKPALLKAMPKITPTGDLTYQAAATGSGVATVTVKALDSQGKYSAGQTFTITVLSDIFVADVGTLDTLPGTGKIVQVKPLSGTQTVVKTGLLNPYGLTMTTNRNLLVSELGFDVNAAAVQKLVGTTLSTVASGNNLVSPVGVIAVSGSGADNVFAVADADTLPAAPSEACVPPPPNGAIVLVDQTTGNQTVLSRGFANLAGITVSGTGELIVTDGGNGAGIPASVMWVDNTGQHLISSGGNLVSPVGIVHEPASGGYVVVDAVAKKLIRILGGGPDGQQIVSCGGLFVHPTHIAIDATGDFIVTDDAAGGGGTAGELGATEPRLIRVKAATGAQTLITSGGNLVSPKGVVTDPKAVNPAE